MTNNRTLSTLCVVSMTVACFNLLGKEALAGDFSKSCDGTVLENGHILRSNCKDRSANSRETSLDLNSVIGNGDGHLSPGSSGYLKTCKNIRLNGNSLQADCLTYNRDWRSTSLNLDNNIFNSDGQLGGNSGQTMF
jgi:CVNH domain